MCPIHPLNEIIKISEKEKHTWHAITCLTSFMCVFCHKRVENLLKGLGSHAFR